MTTKQMVIAGLVVALVGVFVYGVAVNRKPVEEIVDRVAKEDQVATTAPKAPVATTSVPAVVATTTASSTIDNTASMTTVTINTNKGNITLELFTEDAPKTVENFTKLASEGFYDGVIFHRVIEGFMIQGGDPTGTGRGGPGYQFADELNPETESYKRGYVRGTLAMANAGPNTNGSQFFIMHKDYSLPHNYTIFGRVVDGLDVVDEIATSDTDSADRPTDDIVMQKVTVSVE